MIGETLGHYRIDASRSNCCRRRARSSEIRAPGDSSIVYVTRQRLWWIPRIWGTEQKLNDIATGYFRWSQDGGIYCVGAQDGERDLWVLTPANGVQLSDTFVRMRGEFRSWPPG